MSHFFITATDTDAGKTFITHGLLQALQAANIQAKALKPIACGHDAGQHNPDVQALLDLQPQYQASDICAHEFSMPAAPEIAAQAEGLHINIQTLLSWLNAHTQDADICLIEGVGGVMTPLHAQCLLRDWIAGMSHVSTLLVVGSKLGCINHALLSIEALQTVGSTPCCILLNDISNDPPSLLQHASMLRNHAPNIPLISIPYQADSTHFAELLSCLSLTSTPI